MTRSRRIHELDAVRALAIFLVIAAHGLLPFFRTDIGWAVHEPSQWLIADGIAWVVRAFVMPLFFLLSGFWACATARSAGHGELVRQRVVRILVPLVVLVVPVSLAMNAMWDWGQSLDATRITVTGTVPELRAPEHAVTLSNLWFLYYLLIVTGLAVVVAPLASRIAGSESESKTASGSDSVSLPVGWLPLVMSALAALPLWWAGKLQLDIPLGFAVDIPITLFHGVFFLWGWLLRGRQTAGKPLAAYGEHPWLYLILAAIGFAALLPALLDTAISGGEAPLWAFWLSAWFTCATIAATLGLCDRFLARPRKEIRLMSAASYWSYVAHLPALVLVQVVLHQTGLPVSLQYLLAVTAVLVFCLLGYRHVVRPTWLARFLG